MTSIYTVSVRADDLLPYHMSTSDLSGLRSNMYKKASLTRYFPDPVDYRDFSDFTESWTPFSVCKAMVYRGYG